MTHPLILWSLPVRRLQDRDALTVPSVNPSAMSIPGYMESIGERSLSLFWPKFSTARL